MSIKSTVKLTRDEAERKYVGLLTRYTNRSYVMEMWVKGLDDRELESNLEEMNDQVNQGEGFENYRIVPQSEGE